MSKQPFHLDERKRDVFRDLISVLYFLTLAALIGLQLYRQFVLRQPLAQWNDLALVITINALCLLGGGIYLSGDVNLKKLKVSHIVAGYLAFVLVGLLFTIFKYAVLLGQQVGLEQVWEYLLIILPITAILATGWGILGYLGYRRMEKKLE